MMQVYDAEEEALNQEYHLKCKVTVKPITYDDVQSNGTTRRTEDMAFLTPTEGDQKNFFFSAWLPDFGEKWTEIVAVAAHPISGPIRCSVHRTDHRMPHSYIFVMTKSAEEALKAINGREINIVVQPKNKDALGDKQRDYDLALNKNKGIHVDTEKGIEL
jgi:hypothetical protein